MHRLSTLLAVFVSLAAVWAQAPSGATLRGTITDPSGAAVPGAVVQLRGPKTEQRAITDHSGQYNIPAVLPGRYTLRAIAKGFSVTEMQDVPIEKSTVLDFQLVIQAETQVVNVEDEINRVSTDPASNGSALVLKEKELEALSDDPDELSQQLQAMAGPAAGPNGGQIYIDGFTGSNLPPKSSIREVRINSNPYAPEYDRPGFGRIEIFTKPGTDKIRGQFFMQYNKEFLNARSPLLTQSTRPPYQARFFGFDLSGPIKKQKASFTFDFEHRLIDENAYVLATSLDSNLNPVNVNQAVVTPQTRTTFNPRLDYTINASNTLVVRFQNVQIGLDKQGVGDFNLPSRAYNQNETENTVQVTETAVLSPAAINETRFQYMRAGQTQTGNDTVPGTNVQGAFYGGGPTIGNSGNIEKSWELTNTSTLTHGTHTFKWGGRVRDSVLSDTSVSNFAGTFSFFGGTGPQLDANNQPIPGTSVELTALERYQRTLLFQQMGLPASQIRALGGGASQFSLSTGIPMTSLNQMDIGLFANDDWRARPNLTVSYGVRYEAQTNYGDLSDWSPRLGIAWGVDAHANRPAKTVLRAGFGTFYSRIADTVALQALRFNGLTQQSYLIVNPDFYPTIPSPAALAGGQQPQQLQLVAKGIRAPRTYQTSIGIDRQINKYARFSVTYINSRGVHLENTRNINAPINGFYPFGSPGIREETESAGLSRTNMLIANPTVNYKKLFLFGFYALSYGKDNNEGQPANPYDLTAEWGPSTYADIRQRMVIGTSLPLPLKVSISPFLFASTGAPYDITIGQDIFNTGFTTERPALLAGIGQGACQGANLVYQPAFGCFNLNPAPGTQTMERNSGRGPGQVNLGLRVARSWSFGSQGESGPGNTAAMGGMGGGMGGERHGGGGGMGGGGHGGPPPGMFGAASNRKYNLTLSLSARNALNHPNYAAPSGDLSSPYFGEYRSLAGFGPMSASTTYNRRIDIQLRFLF
ncbi:MAG TPA: TonB-dependent receptor [Bryobacteraceae bacterium]|nr:TonB-dependent receptor [Bryobacteraceae bacterium]